MAGKHVAELATMRSVGKEGAAFIAACNTLRRCRKYQASAIWHRMMIRGRHAKMLVSMTLYEDAKNALT